MKKIVIMLLCALSVISMVSCKGSGNSSESQSATGKKSSLIIEEVTSENA